MEETKDIDMIVLIRKIWGAKTKIFRWIIYGILIGIIVVISTPKEYTSIVKVAPEGQKNSNSAGALASMMGITGGGVAQEGVNETLYPEIISSTPFALEFVDIAIEYNGEKMPFSEYILKHQKKPWWNYVVGFPFQLYGWIASIGRERPDTLTIKNTPSIKYAYVASFVKKINMQVDSKKGFMTINSTFQDPIIAKIILDSLVVQLQAYMTNYRTAKTRSDLESNCRMLEIAKQNFYEADEKYANAVDRNNNLISQSASIKLNRLRDERDLTYQIYTQLATQVENDRVKLQAETPIVTVIEPVTVPVRPTKPNGLMIIVAFAFLGGFVFVARIVFKDLMT